MSPRFFRRSRRPRRTISSYDPVLDAQRVWQFGTNLRRLRELRGLTREEVSRECELDEDDLTLMEAGRLEPSLSSHMVPLARALEVSLATLLEGTQTTVPVSPQMGEVLRAMAPGGVDESWVGPQLAEITTLHSRILYPALAQLENGGMVTSRQMSASELPTQGGGSTRSGDVNSDPFKRIFWLTPLGVEMARFVPPAGRDT